MRFVALAGLSALGLMSSGAAGIADDLSDLKNQIDQLNERIAQLGEPPARVNTEEVNAPLPPTITIVLPGRVPPERGMRNDRGSRDFITRPTTQMGGKKSRSGKR